MRNPETLLMATITPFFLMLLFGTVFGRIADIGDIGDFSYIDFIVPGIILQSIGQASQHSAINVVTDMTSGVIERFRSMSVTKSAVLIGHAFAGVVRNAISTTVIICTAFMLGFSSKGSITEWAIVIIVLLLVNISISLLAVLCGLISKTAEGASGLMFPLFILPFISSGFVPTDTMSDGMQWFAKIQPMTPMIDSIRALMLGLPLDNRLWTALVWCVGITVVSFATAIQVYEHKLS